MKTDKGNTVRLKDVNGSWVPVVDGGVPYDRNTHGAIIRD